MKHIRAWTLDWWQSMSLNFLVLIINRQSIAQVFVIYWLSLLSIIILMRINQLNNTFNNVIMIGLCCEKMTVFFSEWLLIKKKDTGGQPLKQKKVYLPCSWMCITITAAVKWKKSWLGLKTFIIQIISIFYSNLSSNFCVFTSFPSKNVDLNAIFILPLD